MLAGSVQLRKMRKRSIKCFHSGYSSGQAELDPAGSSGKQCECAPAFFRARYEEVVVSLLALHHHRLMTALWGINSLVLLLAQYLLRTYPTSKPQIPGPILCLVERDVKRVSVKCWYTLDLCCLSKGPCARGLVFSLVLLKGGRSLYEVKPSGDFRSWGCAL